MSNQKGHRLERPVDSQPLLVIYVNCYLAMQGARTGIMNQTRNWLRDVTPRELWPCNKKDNEGRTIGFTDKDVLKSPRLPVELRAKVLYLLNEERSFRGLMKQELQKHPLYEFLREVKGIDAVLGSKLVCHLEGRLFPGLPHFFSFWSVGGPDWKQDDRSRVRSGICYNIGRCFMRLRPLSGGYKDIYNQRKLYEAGKAWCGTCYTSAEYEAMEKAKKNGLPIPVYTHENCTPAHVLNKTCRYVTKAFLEDLYNYMVENNLIGWYMPHDHHGFIEGSKPPVPSNTA